MDTNEVCYTVTQTLKKIPTSKASLYRGIKAGTIPTKKLNSRLFIPKEWVDSFAKIEPAENV